MITAIIILFISVIYLAITIYNLKKELNQRTSLFAEDDGVGGRVVKNGKGEIILEL